MKLKKYFRNSWKSYNKDALVLIISILIIFTTIALFTLGGAYIIFKNNLFNLYQMEDTTVISSLFGSANLYPSKTSVESTNMLRNMLNNTPIGDLIIGFLFICIGILIGIFLSAGFYGICMDSLRKKKISVSKLIEYAIKRGPRYFIVNILIGLILLLPSFLVIGGGIAASLLYMIIIILLLPFFMMAKPSVVYGRGILESIKESIEIGKNNYIELFVLILTIFLIQILGMIPIIGFIIQIMFIIPCTTLIVCSYYLKNKK